MKTYKKTAGDVTRIPYAVREGKLMSLLDCSCAGIG